MIHWKTKEEMGEGFAYSSKVHEQDQYNSLLKVKPYEKNTMRTYYLVRDWWDNDQLVKLKDYINEILESRKE